MLRPTEKEKLQDCLLLIESAQSILSGLGEGIIPDVESIERCFHDADQKIMRLLRA
jgi:hypothetical protein